MKSYWVSTSQKMTRAMRNSSFGATPESPPSPRTLSTGCQVTRPPGGRGVAERQERGGVGVKAFNAPRTAREAGHGSQCTDDGDLVAAVLARAAGAIRPYFQGELLALGGHEAEPQEERGFARQGEDFAEPLRSGLGDEDPEQRPPYSRALPVRPHREARDFAERTRVDLERAAAHDLAPPRLGDDVLLDVPAQIVVTARQQVAGGNVGGHKRFELRDVGEDRSPYRGCGQRGARGAGGTGAARRGLRRSAPGSVLPSLRLDPGRRAAHWSTSSRIATPRSSSWSLITSGGTSRSTVGPAVTTRRWRSRAWATYGAAGSVSSTPHISPRPRTCATRRVRSASSRSRSPSHVPLRRTSARNAGSPIVRSTSSATPATSGPPPNVVA